MWSPNMSKPLVKMLCHRGPVNAIAVDRSGHYMATSGLDSQLKIWDVRTYQCLHSYYTPKPASSLDISQRGLLSVGCKQVVQVWKDPFQEKQKMPYMQHVVKNEQIQNVGFCPYEDVLGIGHSLGFSSIIVPGAGEPNFDSLEANPFQTAKHRSEAEVHALLDKVCFPAVFHLFIIFQFDSDYLRTKFQLLLMIVHFHWRVSLFWNW